MLFLDTPYTCPHSTEVMVVKDDRNANSTTNVECDEVDKRNVKTIEDLLKHINLQQYTDLFKAEMIDLKMLMNLKSDQIMEMMRDIGILPWGHRHILRTTLEEMNKSLGGEELIVSFATNETDDHIDEPSDCESTHSPCDVLEQHNILVEIVEYLYVI